MFFWLLYSFSGHYTAPPEIPEEDKKEFDYGFVVTPGMVQKYYKADMDPVWASDNMQEHLKVLAQNGWNAEISSENQIERYETISGKSHSAGSFCREVETV